MHNGMPTNGMRRNDDPRWTNAGTKKENQIISGKKTFFHLKIIIPIILFHVKTFFNVINQKNIIIQFLLC